MTVNKIKILLVDDEPGMLEPMAEFLSYELDQYEILTANDGREALDILVQEKIALVISDIKMPRVSGLQLLSEIQTKYSHTSVILMSAYSDIIIRDELKKSNYLNFIQKPFSVSELKDQITGYFDKAADEGFQGTLKNIQLNDIIQMCCLSIISMAIRVWQGSQSGVIYIKNGDIIHATFGETVGEEAFYQIVTWEHGQFETLGDVTAPLVSIHREWQFLLMEAARMVDEKALEKDKADNIAKSDVSATKIEKLAIEKSADENVLLDEKTQKILSSEKRHRVLIVDDSAMMCKILTQLLTEDETIEVVGTAQNGQEALKQISALRPDLITLDVNMPVMDGSTALKHIMIKSPCPVVIVSNISRQSQVNIIDFLRLGAVDFIGKPKKSKDMAIQKQRMIGCIKNSSRACVNHYRRGKAAKPLLEKLKTAPSATIKRDSTSMLVVINSGVGGYGELLKIVPMLSDTMNVAVIALQSMPAEFLVPFSKYLNKRSAARVLPLHREEQSEKPPASGKILAWKLNKGCCYMGTHDLVIQDGAIKIGLADDTYYVGLKNNPEGCGFDYFLQSVVDTFEGIILAVLLSGADVGDLTGLRRIKEKNGIIIAQKPDACMIPEPLQKVKKAGLTSFEDNPINIVKRILNS